MSGLTPIASLVALALVVLIIGYLTYSLLRPERF